MKRNGNSRAVLRGAVASLAGIVAMDLYSRAMKKIASPDNGRKKSGRKQGALDDISVAGIRTRKDEPSTETVARLAYESVADTDPSKVTREKLGQAVHWLYGIGVGAVYGALRSRFPSSPVIAGLGYGTALWILGDEIAVPVLGLAKGPTAHPPAVHAQSLGAHLVYGLTTAAATRVLADSRWSPVHS
jgi:hypothetical protein